MEQCGRAADWANRQPPLDRRHSSNDRAVLTVVNNEAFVIIGASLGGASAAQALREEGFSGPIVLLGDETARPYHRPPLSKDYLQGKADRKSVDVHSHRTGTPNTTST